MFIINLVLKAIDSTSKSKEFSSQSILQAFTRYICIYQERKGHPIEESQHCLSSLFLNKPVYRMNEEIRCITKKGKATNNEWENDDAGFLWALCSVIEKNISSYSYLPINLLKTCVRYFFYQICIFHQMIALQKLWKTFFISSEKLFSFSRYSVVSKFVVPSLFPCQPLL